MKILATTKIGNYDVVLVEGPAVAHGVECDGVTENDGQTIKITLDPTLSPIMYWETFFHELAHAFDMVFGTELPHSVIYAAGRELAASAAAFSWHSVPAPMAKSVPKRARKRAKKKSKG